jgi:hypothetical protein
MLKGSFQHLQFVEEWQDPYRESGIFAHAVQNLDPTNPLAKQYLRVIGNSVADNGTLLLT